MPTDAARPWCLPCREADGSRVWASALGVACEWHFGILSEQEQAELTAAVRRRHPRGGRVNTVLGQIWTVRHDLRQSGSTVERTWRADAEGADHAD